MKGEKHDIYANRSVAVTDDPRKFFYQRNGKLLQEESMRRIRGRRHAILYHYDIHDEDSDDAVGRLSMGPIICVKCGNALFDEVLGEYRCGIRKRSVFNLPTMPSDCGGFVEGEPQTYENTYEHEMRKGE